VKVKYPQKGADVSQSENNKAAAEEARSEVPRSFVRRVKAVALRPTHPHRSTAMLFVQNCHFGLPPQGDSLVIVLS
jgi:hypothetical protein